MKLRAIVATGETSLRSAWANLGTNHVEQINAAPRVEDILPRTTTNIFPLSLSYFPSLVFEYLNIYLTQP